MNKLNKNIPLPATSLSHAQNNGGSAKEKVLHCHVWYH